jgi:hypothetical protein
MGKAGDRVRTDDLEFGKLLLCQLSYARVGADDSRGVAGVTRFKRNAPLRRQGKSWAFVGHCRHATLNIEVGKMILMTREMPFFLGVSASWRRIFWRDGIRAL